MRAIQDLHVSERPREKLSVIGAAALRDEELVAILLGSGSKVAGVQTLAKRVLAVLDDKNGNLALDDLVKIPGIGTAKATQVISALEIARRRIQPHGVKVRNARDVLPLVSHWACRPKEHFLTITLNGAHEVINTRVVTVGLVNSSQIHPREVFSDAIADRACAIIVAHNHPSRDLTPSQDDLKVTKVLREAGKLLGIALIDHVIFSIDGFYSFKEDGQL